MPSEILVRVYADGSGDYTAMRAAVIAEAADLPAIDSYIVFEQKGDLRNTDAFVDFNPYTTDATRNIIIRPIAGDETTSVAGTSGTVYGTNTFILVCRSEFVLFKNLEVDGFSNPFHTASNLTVQDCLIHDGTLVANTAGASVSNTIIYNCAANTLDNVDCDQVTIVSKTSMITTMYRNAGGVLTRNVAYNTSAGNVNYSNTTNASNDENASDDTTAPGTTTFSVSTSDFVNYASDDFDIDSGSSLFTAGSGGTRIGALLTVSGGVTVTATLGAIEYTSQDTTVSLTGSVDITTTLGTISYSSQNTTVSLTGIVDVTATLGLIDYSSQNATVSVTGDIDVISTLGAINYSSNNAVVSLTSEVIIGATLGAIDYTSQNTTVILSGLVDVTATIGSIVYNSYPVMVQIGEGQLIGNVTAGFADDIYTAGFKPDTITVSFK